MGKYYQTTIEKSFGNRYVKISIDDPTFTVTAKTIISKFVKCAYIKKEESKLKGTIYAYPDTGNNPCSDKDLQTLNIKIQRELNKISYKILKIRGLLIKQHNALKVYDRCILRMMRNEFSSELIQDMFIVASFLIFNLSDVSIVSAICQIKNLPIIQSKKENVDFRITTKSMFSALNTLIVKYKKLESGKRTV